MAKKPKVKCPVCQEQFYREDCDFETDGRRYYHKECFAQVEQDKIIVQEIHEKMRKLLGENYSQAKITRQINTLVKEGKTKQGIKLTLDYWYDIKKESAEKAAGGIGIVSYIYPEAQKYWERKEWLDSRDQNIDLSCYDKPIKYEINPTPIAKPKRVKLFKLD